MMGEKMYLNVGCGRWNFSSWDQPWVHIDKSDLPHVTSKDVFLRGYGDNWVGLIYSSHLIAYFNKDEAEELLRCWYRVLKPGFQLNIATPDLTAMMSLYGTYPIEDFIGPLYGEMNEKTIYHKMAYDERSLSKLLHKVGFSEVRRINTGFFPQFKDQSWAYLPDKNYSQGTLISLNLIATK